MIIDWAKYAAAILCGGRSRRMGFDKSLALRDKNGRTLLASLAGELSRRFGEVVLVTNDVAKLAPVEELSLFRHVEDLHPGSGPAGAIHTALKTLPGRPFFVMACDMPVIDWECIGNMGRLLEENRADVAAPRKGEWLEPLYAFYGPRTEPAFHAALAGGSLAVRAIFSRVHTVYLDLDERDPQSGLFKNLNTPEDLLREGLPLPQRR